MVKECLTTHVWICGLAQSRAVEEVFYLSQKQERYYLLHILTSRV